MDVWISGYAHRERLKLELELERLSLSLDIGCGFLRVGQSVSPPMRSSHGDVETENRHRGLAGWRIGIGAERADSPSLNVVYSSRQAWEVGRLGGFEARSPKPEAAVLAR